MPESENHFTFGATLHHGGVACFVVLNGENIGNHWIQFTVVKQAPELLYILLLLRGLLAEETTPEDTNERTPLSSVRLSGMLGIGPDAKPITR